MSNRHLIAPLAQDVAGGVGVGGEPGAVVLHIGNQIAEGVQAAGAADELGVEDEVQHPPLLSQGVKLVPPDLAEVPGAAQEGGGLVVPVRVHVVDGVVEDGVLGQLHQGDLPAVKAVEVGAVAVAVVGAVDVAVI